MSKELTTPSTAAVAEQVLIQGDLSSLNVEQRTNYYMKVCESVGLNPYTRPFEYIVLNEKLTLYAKRDATDQLRKVHEISVNIVNREKIDDVYIVTAKATTKDGRSDESTGVVSIAKEDGEWAQSSAGKRFFKKNGNIIPLKGDDLANAFMKAETKAKRRVTLSICGLGMLDETEVETIKDITPPAPEAKSIFKTATLRKEWVQGVIDAINATEGLDELKVVAGQNKPKLDEMIAQGNDSDLMAVDELRKRLEQKKEQLKEAALRPDLDEDFNRAFGLDDAPPPVETKAARETITIPLNALGEADWFLWVVDLTQVINALKTTRDITQFRKEYATQLANLKKADIDLFLKVESALQQVREAA